MKRLIFVFLLLLSLSSTAIAGGWWNDWREEPDYGPSSDYDEGYEEGYYDGYNDGVNDPFGEDDNKISAFGYWFLSEEWTEQELHAWAAVFESLTDNRDRYPWARNPIVNAVYIAPITGTVYHKEDCTAINNASFILELDLKEAQERGFDACSKCD